MRSEQYLEGNGSDVISEDTIYGTRGWLGKWCENMASKKLSKKYHQTASVCTRVTAANCDMEEGMVLDAADWGLPVVTEETAVQDASAESEAASTKTATEE